MKFSRLKLHGFKSFSDETTLVMEPGLTGIVGPNGCGKSNLVEAMRWVMGESSYKAMRASGMDDVIFSGSGNRPGRNSAEVTLVLDNSDRTAPAALNNADILEVTRRIEREAGSVYRVNGKEVRARDVQLLFADASTGAHSPAMVRQGQIGELIAAKPTARRALLEEAAGISGLHSRRHEAELRLRAAEANLERVDDIIAQVETQLETLKRQARLATRYRGLSGDIRRAEATLFHIRWVAARYAEKETQAQQAVLVRELADATHLELQAQKKLEAADAALQPLRDREAVTGAVLQRYTILSEQLAEEARRASQRQAELQDRIRQLAADGQRERDLVAESETTLAANAEELSKLQAEGAAAQADFDIARGDADVAKAAVAAAEIEARNAADALAQVRARRDQAERSKRDADTRMARLTQQIADVETEARNIAARLDADETLNQKRTALVEAQSRTAETEQAATLAEEATAVAQSKLDAARPRLAEIDAALNRLEAEATTLGKMLNVGSGLWPAIVDELKVTPGYETALGAALGDDLEASSDAGAPMHWSVPVDHSDDAALPQAAEPLSRYVTGSPLLKRRLDQIGLIHAVDGPSLMHALKPGQRLVTLEGAVWRWDGFIAAADAPSAAAQRLAQRNRLAELDEEITRTKGERNGWKRDVDALVVALDGARQDERHKREAWRAAQHAIGAAQIEVDKAQRAIGDLTTRQSTLEEARLRLATSLGEAEAQRGEAEQALAAAGTEDDAAKIADAKQGVLTGARERADQARLKLGSFETAAQMRRGRVAQLERDTQSWSRRRDSARAQLSTLDQRTAEVQAQLETASETPDGFAARRAQLDDQIETAKIEHKAAGDSFNVAQTSLREADKTLRLASETLSNARIELTRIEERVKGFIAQRQQIERQIDETLDIPASRTLEASGIKAEESLPTEAATEQKVDRLKAERERLGGVNLSAEKEAIEVQEKLDLMVNDKNDLIEAIAKLRTGIASLNREGRARLNEAFVKVNEHFQELFTTLFGGGTAELTFVESDDPLEAGLEIIARPPGKKPQTMTLLSGGEQALTAMSLIFAVFLTNPAPICVLDEVDAPLDDANVERFCNLLDSMRQRTNTRFMVITHNPITMSRVDRLFGVTMAERGVSQLVSVDLTTAETFLEVG
ncbi:chromosome segregation protein SMC [Devosia neptuniae]|jgi:chromosome segregation protein|uniref:chromosome segregation protein SMC n=1 Tax=Devosia TaxID=46913 RepID=UPI0022AEA88A|nr:chromosome segregation protein SMC [Devosia neptuniae]MCZ4344653.1 chromosome segregation protein SMC [Devosia neptuniae]|tara:strand:+ start:49821 stop:53276 length:3456 start_codon:yes stop_codon:yes gene_type:complete